MNRIYLLVSVLTALVALLGGVQWVVSEWRAWTWRRKQTGKWLVLVGLWCLPSVADASCSGSGIAFTCTSGSTIAQLQSAYDSGTTNGDVVITLDAGSYSWSTTIALVYNKGLRITCATAPATSAPWGAAESGGCNVAATGLLMEAYSDYITNRGTVTRYYGFDGLNFTNIPTSENLFWGLCNCTMTKVLIHSNSFTYTGGSSGPLIRFGGAETSDDPQRFYGVFYHNKLRGAAPIQIYNNTLLDHGTSSPINTRGSGDAFFVEDNDLRFTTGATSDGNCADTQGGGAWVTRFNYSHNCRWILHGVDHDGGPWLWEFYGNVIIQDANGYGDVNCLGCWSHQGSGETYLWRNNFTSSATMDSTAAHLHHYRGSHDNPDDGPLGLCDGTQVVDGNRTPLATYRGYPCYHQPGRDFQGNLRPVFEWLNLNTATGDIGPFSASSNGGSPDYYSLHIQHNRDYYSGVSKDAQTSATSPFNGTVGMGFGTLANRPTTCTTFAATGADAPDAGNSGVGYFATDQGSWNSSSSNTGVDFAGQDGILYMCTATNTWTAWYTPYTYPHPLRTDAGDGGSPASSVYPTLWSRANWLMEVATLCSLSWRYRQALIALGLTVGMCIAEWGGAAKMVSVQAVSFTVHQVRYGSALMLKRALRILPEKNL